MNRFNKIYLEDLTFEDYMVIVEKSKFRQESLKTDIFLGMT